MRVARAPARAGTDLG